MKRIMIAFLALASATSLMAQNTATDGQKKKFSDVAKFDKETYDFGKIKQNVPAVATFTVTNISKEPIVIEQANPTCGCTISDYTKSPIAPGKTGTIKATYNAAAAGAIHKTLTVKIAGIDEMKSISLAGEVVAAAPAAVTTPAGTANATLSTTPAQMAVDTKVKTVTKTDTSVVKEKTKKKNGKSKKIVKTTKTEVKADDLPK